MTAGFALDLAFDRVRLLAAREDGWTPVGEVLLTDPAFGKALATLRREQAGAAEPCPADLVIPDSQILYTQLSATSEDTIGAALERITPYKAADLVWGREGDLPDLRIAATTSETIEEARRFAAQHGFAPGRIIARPAEEGFPAELVFADPAPTEATEPGGGHVPTGAAEVTTPGIAPKPAEATEPDYAQPSVDPSSPVPDAEEPALSEAEALTLLGRRGRTRRSGAAITLAVAALVALLAIAGVFVLSGDRGTQQRATVEMPLPSASPDAASASPSEHVRADSPPAASEALVETAPVRLASADPSADLGQDPTSAREATATAPLAREVTNDDPGPPRPRSGEPGAGDEPPTEVARLDSPGITFAAPPTSAADGDGAGETADIPPDLDIIARDATPPLRPSERPETIEVTREQDDQAADDQPAQPSAAVSATDDPVPAEAGDDLPTEESSPPAETQLAALQDPGADIPADEPVQETVTAPQLELPTVRPQARPETERDAEPVEPAETPLRPRPRPERDAALQEQAVPVPPNRPADFAALARAARQQSSAASAGSARASAPSGSVRASVAAAPATAPAPTATQTQRPAMPTKTSVAKAATTENALRLRQLNLIGVYGAPSQRRALIRLPSGKYVKVKVGDRIDGGKIAAIDSARLRYVKNGRTVTLSMPPT